MKDDWHQSLEEISGTHVSRETFQRLLAFEVLFKKWSGTINLSSRSQLEVLWDRHILDSAQVLRLSPHALRWLDLGSGGGFPGAILAILLRQRQDAGVDLVESNGKKASFLRTSLAGCENARVHTARIEAIATDATVKPDVVTARALAPLSRLLGLAEPWIKGQTAGLFYKGREFRAEIEEARDAWHFDLLEHKSRIDPDAVILEISGLRSRHVKCT